MARVARTRVVVRLEQWLDRIGDEERVDQPNARGVLGREKQARDRVSWSWDNVGHPPFSRSHPANRYRLDRKLFQV